MSSLNIPQLTNVTEYSLWFTATCDGQWLTLPKSELSTEQITELHKIATPAPKPRKKAKRSNGTRRPTGQTRKSWSAAEVLRRGAAMAELVERVNEEREAA